MQTVKIVSVNRYDQRFPTEFEEECHDFWQLKYLRNGTAEILTDETVFSMEGGQAFLIPPGKKHKVHLHGSSTVSYAVASFLWSEDTVMPALPLVPYRLDSREEEYLVEFFYTAPLLFSGSESNRPKSREAAASYCETLFSAFLLRLWMRTQGEEQYLLPERCKTNTHQNYALLTEKIKSYLYDHVAENISLDLLARSIGCSVNSMMRIFKADTGVSIIVYFNQMKIDRAVSLIRESSYSVNEIAEYLSFHSVEYFSRVFKRYTGLSPTEFSKNQKKWQGCLSVMFDEH